MGQLASTLIGVIDHAEKQGREFGGG